GAAGSAGAATSGAGAEAGASWHQPTVPTDHTIKANIKATRRDIISVSRGVFFAAPAVTVAAGD
ncbi:MAG: hypothetical protein WCK05_15150, partial [Planctomycetota bacterium]